jgi:Mn2+/Fe2+ NRAMP family transporter
MRIEQFIVLGYLFLGVSIGFVSNYFTKNNSALTFALTFPLFLYFVSLFPLLKFVRQKKKTWLFYNTFITFILVWLVVWILLYNL